MGFTAALALEDSTLQSVRNIQHRDRDGNVIGEYVRARLCDVRQLMYNSRSGQV